MNRMLGEMTAEDLAEWQAFDTIEPIGRKRDDYLIAQLCAVIANTMGGGKKGKALTVKDFIPPWGGRKQKRQSMEDMKAALKALAGVKNG